MSKILSSFSFLLLIFLSYVCYGNAMSLALKSPAFNNGGYLPEQYTCDGTDRSPPLVWENSPASTQSFVLIMDDPDAPMGVWTHWVLFNIPARINAWPENLQNLPPGTQTGKNSWQRNQYNGPCPPSGTHRYFFKLYALDTVLELTDGASKDEVETTIQNHILAQASLMAIYQRK